MTMTLFYRSYLITFRLLLGAIAGLVLYLDQTDAISLHWPFTALAAIGVLAASILATIGALGNPATVERWATTRRAMPKEQLTWRCMPCRSILLSIFSRSGTPASSPSAKCETSERSGARAA
ncbi:hypothetical protein MRBLMR1_003902 [Neorhizobium sp. LMR1-1-1.1]